MPKSRLRNILRGRKDLQDWQTNLTFLKHIASKL
nr:MAG TPA: hypothetical protein [Caudoviricetes sp.]